MQQQNNNYEVILIAFNYIWFNYSSKNANSGWGITTVDAINGLDWNNNNIKS